MIPATYYHATPLHYLPHLLQTGVLCSQRRLRERALPIAARPSAKRRDRKLRLDSFVHLSLTPITPLLIDKCRRGYPHVLLEFRAEIAAMPGAAYLKYNTKAWRHRDDFVPVRGPEAIAAFIKEWKSGLYPSAELLIDKELPLPANCTHILFPSNHELAWALTMTEAARIAPPAPFEVWESNIPSVVHYDRAPLQLYLAQTLAANTLIPPPDLPFD